MFLPSQYASADPLELLRQAEQGLVGLDQRLMGALIARPESTLAALAKFTAEPNPDRLVDLDEQVFDLYRHFNHPQAAPFYISLLRENLSETPDEIVEALAALGPAAVEPLLELHRSVAPEDACDVVFVLAATGVKDPRIVDLLLPVLAADPYEGALSIGLYGDPSLAPQVQAALDALPPASVEERKALQDCLESLADAGVVADQPEPFEMLSTYPEAVSPLFDYLDNAQIAEFLRCPEPAYRHDAALSLVDMEYPEELTEILIELASSEPDAQVRQAVLRSLGEQVEQPRVRTLLEDVLASRDQDPRVRAGALVALAQDTSTEAFRATILEFLADPATRAAAVQAMWRSDNEIYIPSIGPALRDVDIEVRIQAIRAIGAFPIPALAIELIPLFADEDLREDALYAYASAVNAKISPKSVQRILDDIEEKADGLSVAELEAVSIALDARLTIEGFDPVFHQLDDDFDDEDCGHDHSHGAPELNPTKVAPALPAASKTPTLPGGHKVGRNDPCPCGSGKKFKKCCGK
jgi:HEAT repeat protein